MVLPAKFREEVLELVVSRGLDGCVWGFNRADWEIEAKKQLELPITEKSGRDLRRYLFSAAELVKLDDQGRFVIPQPLMDYASLNDQKMVAFVGAGDHFEIWNLKDWTNIKTQLKL